MRRLIAVSLAILSLMVLCIGVAAGQTTVPDPSADAGGFLGFILNAVVGRNWILVAAAACVGLTYLLRTFGAKWVPWFGTDRGGAVLVLVIGMLGGIGSALAEGKPWWSAILGGLGLAATSAGAFVIPKKIAAPAPATP